MVKQGFRKGAKLERFEKALADPSKTLKQIGVMAVAEFQEAFRKQRLGRQAWKPRGEVNVMGIIADFVAGKDKPPSRRFQTQPALMDTGRLRSSIAFEIDRMSVSVGSNLPYASTHQFGGEVESAPLTEDVQTRIAAWLRGEDSARQEKLGWLVNPALRGETVKSEVPARPFVGITPQLVEDIHEIIGVEIFEVR